MCKIEIGLDVYFIDECQKGFFLFERVTLHEINTYECSGPIMTNDDVVDFCTNFLLRQKV